MAVFCVWCLTVGRVLCVCSGAAVPGERLFCIWAVRASVSSYIPSVSRASSSPPLCVPDSGAHTAPFGMRHGAPRSSQSALSYVEFVFETGAPFLLFWKRYQQLRFVPRPSCLQSRDFLSLSRTAVTLRSVPCTHRSLIDCLPACRRARSGGERAHTPEPVPSAGPHPGEASRAGEPREGACGEGGAGGGAVPLHW